MFSFFAELLSRSLVFLSLHFDRATNFPKPLPKKTEIQYLELAKKGDENARNKLIEHNLRLVSYIVRKQYSSSNEQDDLISIGIIGLIKAVETFNTEKSVSFSTYASKCIDNEIKMHFRKNKHRASEVYIDEPIETDKNGNELKISDIFKDPCNVGEEVILRTDVEKLYSFINEELDERERLIICTRYGLPTTKGTTKKIHTQKEVADMLGISRSYISRIEKKALEKLAQRFNQQKP